MRVIFRRWVWPSGGEGGGRRVSVDTEGDSGRSRCEPGGQCEREEDDLEGSCESGERGCWCREGGHSGECEGVELGVRDSVTMLTMLLM